MSATRRIVLVNRLPPLAATGATRVVWSLGTALADRGWDVHFLTPTSPERLPPLERVTFHEVPVPADEDRASSVFFLTGLTHFRRVLAAVRPHLVYDNCNPLPFVPGYPLAWSRMVTRIHHVYGAEVFRHKKGLLNPLATLMGEQWFRVLDGRRVVVDSASTKRRLTGMVRRADRIQIISPGIDLAGLPSPSTEVERDPHLAAVISRLAPNKGIDVLLRAWRLVEDRNDDVRLVVGGTGRAEGELMALAGDLGLRRVEFLGFVSEEQKWDLLRRCALYPFPTHIEGLPIGILEAMALGAPVVSTRVPGVVDVVQDRSTGLLVEPSDPPALARGIQELFAGDELRGQLAKNAREAVEARDLERVTAQEAEYLEGQVALQGRR